VPAFENKELENMAIYWEHEGNKAIRFEDYKLVSQWKKDSEYNWELYDLKKDRSEINNLMEEMPDKALEMETMWKTWARKTGVKTWGTKLDIE
jgi:arylsulfatase